MNPQKSNTRNKAAALRPANGRIKIPEHVQLRLWVKSGGLCQFRGCNDDLYTEKLTLKPDKLANIAHIVAASPDGPRGDDPMPVNQRNDFDNLMLVCLDHHSHMDKKFQTDYSTEDLRQWKKEHEDRVRWLLTTTPNPKTKVVRLRAKIGNETGQISEPEFRQAILPRYPLDSHGIEIDLTAFADGGSAYWEACQAAISEKLAPIHASSIHGPKAEHLSVFAIAPIPLLIHLGRCIGNKIPSTFYQRHRDTQDWLWKSPNGKEASYSYKLTQDGKSKDAVLLILSLSGTIDIEQIPEDVRANRAVYTMTLDGQQPNTEFLKTEADLENFRVAYQKLLGQIRAHKPETATIHLFPAIPAPIALTCGRELLEKAHPSLLIHDYNKINKKFTQTLRVN
ncbi:MAG: SAVED domain-containing protein [Candidatus Melainabacteria bacterium]|nr:SAVED domain-containing protein [Candidatus Melainabacteria bacterium]